jgi:hypothetical protein
MPYSNRHLVVVSSMCHSLRALAACQRLISACIAVPVHNQLAAPRNINQRDLLYPHIQAISRFLQREQPYPPRTSRSYLHLSRRRQLAALLPRGAGENRGILETQSFQVPSRHPPSRLVNRFAVLRACEPRTTCHICCAFDREPASLLFPSIRLNTCVCFANP